MENSSKQSHFSAIQVFDIENNLSRDRTKEAAIFSHLGGTNSFDESDGRISATNRINADCEGRKNDEHPS